MKKLIFFLLLFCLLLIYSDCTTISIIRHQTSDPDDYKIFDTRIIKSPEPQEVFRFAYNVKKQTEIASLILSPKFEQNQGLKQLPSITLGDFLIKSRTNAFLVIRNDTILFEKYFNGYNESSISNSFSMGKTIISTLIGISLEEGLINSIEDPIVKYIPELKSIIGFEKIKIIHLLQMTSGIKFSEDYQWFSDAAYLYYTKDRRKLFSELTLEHEPGTKWKYKSIDSALLSLILSKAVRTTVSYYAEEKLWKPLGMEYDGLWALDSNESGIEKTSCCVFASARDFAKFGRLFANKGMWNGKRLLSEEYFEQATAIDESNGSVWDYQYQWWMPWWLGRINDPFYAHGFKGQRLIISPSKNMIIVKLSDDPEGDNVNKEYYMEMFKVILESM